MIKTLNETLAEEFDVEITKIVPEANIKEMLDLDSLALVDLVALIETTFDIKIKGQEILSVKTMGDLYDFLYIKLSNEYT